MCRGKVSDVKKKNISEVKQNPSNLLHFDVRGLLREVIKLEVFRVDVHRRKSLKTI